MCSPNSVSALQPTPSSSAPSLQFPTLPTRCPFAQSAVAVSHSSTPRRRSSSRRLSPLPLLEVQSTSPSPSPSPTLQDSRSPSPSLTPGLQVKKQQALDKKGVEKIAKSALSPQTKPQNSTGMLSHIQF
nr:hypothetical protein Itr_chr07CG18660 [Ipomoea trifida]